jgi:hypothetical protein
MFVQLVEFTTDRIDEMNQLMDRWAASTEGRRTATRAVLGRDRAVENHFVEVIEFPTYEEAMRNSKLPETNHVFEQMTKLCDGPPRFLDLDVIRTESL